MISALSFLIAIIPAPALPAGVATDFQAAVNKVEQQLEAGNFAAARTGLAAFPKANLGFAWDDSNVPVQQREHFRGIRLAAIGNWQVVTKEFNFVENPKASLRISFAAENPIGDSRNITPVIFKRNGGALEAVISLTRGTSPTPATEADIQKSIAQAFGTYLGVTSLPYAQTAMSPIDVSIPHPAPIIAYEASIAFENLNVLNTLRKCAEEKTKVKANSSQLSLARSSVNLGKIYQGEDKEFEVEVVNDGDGVAKLWIRPDCGCIVAPGIVEIPPKSKTKVPIAFTSDEFFGPIRKHLNVISNDPVKPVQNFEFELQIDLVYQFISPAGNVAIIGDGPSSNDIFLTFNVQEPFEIKKAMVNGVDIPVTFEPWSGRLADVPRQEPEKDRKGYKFHLEFPTNLPPGRTTSSLVLVTDSTIWPMLTYNFSMQKGIAALPETLMFGTVSTAKTARITVARPNRPFKITSVESNSEYFTAEVEPATKPDEFTIAVTYMNNAPSGNLKKKITIHTDDPAQPTLVVSLNAKIQ